MSSANELEPGTSAVPPPADLKEPLGGLRATLEDLDAQARSVVKERPMLALGMALAFGYLLGRALARK